MTIGNGHTEPGASGASKTPVQRPPVQKKPPLENGAAESVGARGAHEDFLESQESARLLFRYCISSGKNVSESIHNLFITAENFAGDKPDEIENLETLNGIPSQFAKLSPERKAWFCYNQVIDSLSSIAYPVTVDSLRATKRSNEDDPKSSPAGWFVHRVTKWVSCSVFLLGVLYASYLIWEIEGPEKWAIEEETATFKGVVWVVFGCVGALVHLLNHALTTTRLKTFETSEQRKVGPRLLLGGMFGFVLPWLLSSGGSEALMKNPALLTVAAFFGGYSVRFSIGLLERLLSALFPETQPKR